MCYGTARSTSHSRAGRLSGSGAGFCSAASERAVVLVTPPHAMTRISCCACASLLCQPVREVDLLVESDECDCESVSVLCECVSAGLWSLLSFIGGEADVLE